MPRIVTVYIYFVSYAHEYGFGNAEISLDHEITSIADTKALAEMIGAHAPNPVVLYYHLLRTHEVPA